MEASRILIEKIKEFEGYKAQAYKCPAGIWTVGYGHTGNDVDRYTSVTREQAERMLRRDLHRFEAFVSSLNVTCKQEKFDALVDFCFNLGTTALERSTLLRKIRGCRPNQEIKDEFMKWVYARVNGKKVKLEGLVKRREWEAKRYFNEV